MHDIGKGLAFKPITIVIFMNSFRYYFLPLNFTEVIEAEWSSIVWSKLKLFSQSKTWISRSRPALVRSLCPGEQKVNNLLKKLWVKLFFLLKGYIYGKLPESGEEYSMLRTSDSCASILMISSMNAKSNTLGNENPKSTKSVGRLSSPIAFTPDSKLRVLVSWTAIQAQLACSVSKGWVG